MYSGSKCSIIRIQLTSFPTRSCVTGPALERKFFRICKKARIQESNLQRNLHNWIRLLDHIDDEQLRHLLWSDASEGLKSGWNGDERLLPQTTHHIARTPEEFDAITRDLAKEMVFGRAIPIANEPLGYCRLLTVLKPNGTRRVCRDYTVALDGLRSINMDIPPEKTRTIFPDLLQFVRCAIQVGPNGHMARADGKNFYRQFRMHPTNIGQFAYKWLGETILDYYLGYGLSSATQNIQRMSEAICTMAMRDKLPLAPELWALILAYVDDFVIFGPSACECWEMSAALFETANELGITFSPDKFLPPAPKNKAIGFIFDLPRQQVHIPEPKLRKARMQITSLLNADVVRTKAVERLLGLLQWMAAIIFPSKAMLRVLTYQMTQCHHHGAFAFRLSDDARTDLQWWLEWAKKLNACPFAAITGELPDHHIWIYTDASDWGIGAWLLPHRRYIFMAFTDMPEPFCSLPRYHISVREAFAVSAAVLSWKEFFKNEFIRFFVDNKPVKQAFEKLWSANVNIMNQIRCVALEAAISQFRFFTHWISTDHNYPADKLSRNEFSKFREAVGDAPVIRDLVLFDQLAV